MANVVRQHVDSFGQGHIHGIVPVDHEGPSVSVLILVIVGPVIQRHLDGRRTLHGDINVVDGVIMGTVGTDGIVLCDGGKADVGRVGAALLAHQLQLAVLLGHADVPFRMAAAVKGVIICIVYDLRQGLLQAAVVVEQDRVYLLIIDVVLRLVHQDRVVLGILRQRVGLVGVQIAIVEG